MTNYSFDPPAKKAMDEMELSELISGMNADEDGIEKAMKILQEQEALRVSDEENFQNWRAAMIKDGSVEALKAVEAATGETLIEPEPESVTEEVEEITAEINDQSEQGETPAVNSVIEDDLSSEEVAEELEEESTQLETESEPEAQETVIEVSEERIQMTETDDGVEVSYQSSTVVAELSTVSVAASLDAALDEAVTTNPSKIRQRISSKFLLGVSAAVAAFGLLLILHETVLGSSEFASFGFLLGGAAATALVAVQSFQKTSFSSSVSNKLAWLGGYWKYLIALAVGLVFIAFSNLARDYDLFAALEVEPALIVDYELDEISLLAIFAILFAVVLAWQPMLRFALLRLFGVLALVSLGLILSGIETSEVSIGDFDYESLIAGFITSFLLITSLQLLTQPNFAADHEREAWAAGEFNSRLKRVSTLHALLLVALPTLLASVFSLSGFEFSQAENWVQVGGLIAVGLALLVLVAGSVDFENRWFKTASLVVLVAALVVSEYLTNDWVSALFTMGGVAIAALVSSSLIIRFAKTPQANPVVVIIGLLIALTIGWLIENPLGLLDLGFEGYSDLSGWGAGALVAVVVGSLFALASVISSREVSHEDS
jgi:hypothetical protein